MKLTLGFSPCPNDTFIFDALVNKKIDTGGLDFEVHLEDVQTLNQWALQGRLDVTKISYGVLPLVLDRYELLDSGGALGKGVGPLLITTAGHAASLTGQTPAPGKVHAESLGGPTPAPGRRDVPEQTPTLEQTELLVNTGTVAIPGENTTAHLLFSLAFPQARNKKFMIFSEIENAVLSRQADCGVIIHEGRFTYRQKGLAKLTDLGEFWEEKTGCPIPLGGILMRREQDPALAATVNGLIRKSLEYAFGHYPILPEYVRQHAQEMDEQVMRQHIDLYVNDYSLSLGEDGRKAVDTLLQVYAGLHPAENAPAQTAPQPLAQ
ncbi:MAG TPA: 1,4-dihydroxy-6-naphthoate synthase [Puia sp.]|nr:1,4-dihydroxy-6-naphthoate synthase [Puia sp.]